MILNLSDKIFTIKIKTKPENYFVKQNRRLIKMKFLLFSIFITVASATFDSSGIFSKKLIVPEDPKEFLRIKAQEGYIEQSRDERIANGTDAVDGQFPYAVNFR